jgi:hypothetical protein
MNFLSAARFCIKTRPVKNLLVQRSFGSCSVIYRDLPNDTPKTTGRAPLEGIRVLDLTRVLGKKTKVKLTIKDEY